MKSKKRLLASARLYCIADKGTVRITLSAFVSAARRSCIDILQWRDKSGRKAEILRDASRIKKSLDRGKIIFIINDYLDVAQLTNADGLHIGQTDISIQDARDCLGRDKIIGVSCHNLRQALDAQRKGADYIGIGPVFSTPTKPEYKSVGLNTLRKVSARLRIPVFAIGSIEENILPQVVNAGARRIAVCRALCCSDNPVKTAKRLKAMLR